METEAGMELDNVENGMPEFGKSVGCIMGQVVAIDVGKPTCRVLKWDGSNRSWEEDDEEWEDGCPSKFLIMCLNYIQNALEVEDGGSTDHDKPFYASHWGFEFWSGYSNGNDVLDMEGGGSKIEKIAWIASTAADTIATKEKDDVPFDDPFLLYLVPSKDAATEVREVCKVLEEVGICTLFLDSGVSIDLQTQCIKSVEPEFIISTPERILELLSLKAIDISGLSFMVVDGLEEAPSGGTYLDAVKSIRQFVSGNTQTVCFGNCMNTSSNSDGGSVCK